jgi:hypothetical protein
MSPDYLWPTGTLVRHRSLGAQGVVVPAPSDASTASGYVYVDFGMGPMLVSVDDLDVLPASSEMPDKSRLPGEKEDPGQS